MAAAAGMGAAMVRATASGAHAAETSPLGAMPPVRQDARPPARRAGGEERAGKHVGTEQQVDRRGIRTFQQAAYAAGALMGAWPPAVTARALSAVSIVAACWLGGVAVAMPSLAQRGVGTPAAILLAAPGVLALLSVALLPRRRAAQRDLRARLRERRQHQLSLLPERLSRLRDPQDVAAQAETLARGVLDAAEATVSLGESLELSAPEWLARQMRASDGTALGILAVRFPGDRPATEAEAAALAKLADAIAVALESANLLADAVRAKSEVELILNTISDGMFVLDRHWSLRYVNNAALRYLRRERDEMLGASLWALFPGLREAEFGERFEYAMRSGENVDFAAAYAPLNAFYEMRCYPFEGGLTVYFRDIAAQRETEEKLRQSQKLEALGQLTGGIAHDVNNLLTVILGNFEMLAMSAEERGEEGVLDLSLAEAGLRAGESASQLMHRLLAFSRRQPLSPQVIDVAALLSSLEPLLRRTLGEPIALRIGWQDGLWRALVDPAELENAILNLAINARDAMPSGGRLTIEAGNVPIDRVYAATAGLDRTGDYIMLSVADTGHGMSRDVLAKAFDPFFTTKQPGKGTGLGLSMVYGFAKQSGGHAMIDSEASQGTIVRLYLPRTGADEAAPAPVPDREAARGDETILVVEDNELVRAHTEAMLRGLGYKVLSAGEGPAALRMIEAGAAPDLLLTDVVLPGGMSGRDLADAAARAVPGLRVLFTSGYPGNVLLENGRMVPGVELVGKPFRRAHLAARIRTQLAGAPWPVAGRGPPPGNEGSLSWRRA
jgi:signal transduction histidine kinase